MLALLPGYIALHVRRTDHVFTGQTTDEDFCAFVERHASQKAFVATDNPETQQLMAARLGPRLNPELLARMGRPARSLRRTNLHSSAVDLFTCAAADVFKGSYYSSFSDTIDHLRRLQGRADQRDEHEVASTSMRADMLFGLGHTAEARQLFSREVASEAKLQLPCDLEPSRTAASPQKVPPPRQLTTAPALAEQLCPVPELFWPHHTAWVALVGATPHLPDEQDVLCLQEDARQRAPHARNQSGVGLPLLRRREM